MAILDSAIFNLIPTLEASNMPKKTIPGWVVGGWLRIDYNANSVQLPTGTELGKKGGMAN